MSRRLRRASICGAIALVILAGCTGTGSQPGIDAATVHARAITIDTHVDIPANFGHGDADPGVQGHMQYDLHKMVAGGIDAAFFIVYVRQGELTAQGYRDAYLAAMQKFEAIAAMTGEHSERIALVRSADELEANVAAGKLSALIGVENGYPLGPALEHLDEFAARGARYISITHDGNNQLGTSARPRPEEPGEDTGLTATGRALVTRLNDLGIMLDVSHASDQSTLEAAALSRAPVIASHSSAAAVFDHPRNLSDAEIQAIAATGGVVQVVAFDSYLRAVNAENEAALLAAMGEVGFDGPQWFARATQAELAALRDKVRAVEGRWPRANVAHLVDHVDYITALVGVDHVGLSSDFGGGGGISGWDNASESAAVTAELVRRGYSEADILKIWGGNLLRVWREVERQAAESG
ncbi:MAG: membrane dipeptidase [Halioglobus sp.]|nr:membrane dipeptidase [Halioglobus sp.]